MGSLSINDKINLNKSHLKHFVVQTRSFQIEKYRDINMYPVLRTYIRKKNEKRKQEMEMSEELKRAKREKELKHNQDKLTLEEIKEEIVKNKQKLTELEIEKHRLFAEFKKVLHEDDNRKNLQRLKETNIIPNMTFGPPQSTSLAIPISTNHLQSSQSIASSSSVSASQINPSANFPIKLGPVASPQSSGHSKTRPPMLPEPSLLPLYPMFAHNTSMPSQAAFSLSPSIITSSTASSSLSFTHPPVRPLNPEILQPKPLVNSNPTSMYPKPLAHPIHPPLMAINAPRSTNSMVGIPVSLPPVSFSSSPMIQDRQRNSFKRGHDAQPMIVSSAPPPPSLQPLNLASAHQNSSPHLPAFIPGYRPPANLHQGPLHPNQLPPSIPSIDQIQGIPNIPFYQSLMMNSFINPNSMPK
ncbi:hypothetical protein QR98_0011500 [Sarcoptes scabiei]|uniref:Uncharacterized protein n=1 Tax=Sarcoptes scabiei TaxID=52283 RepID=A0A131ZV84_SARSC|nr:hypothetical protein QR98_0011500 [Sarcoptes scabiei]